MAETHPAPKLAARRPDWELPELHAGIQLSPLDSLYDNKERMKCPKCGRARAHYCYDCLESLVPFPRVELPFRVSIVTHHEEKASKNTGVQVAILAAGQVDLHSMTQVPTDVDPSRCAVLFPSETALEVEQLEPDSIDRLFIIDSKWKKANSLVRTDTFCSMRAVRLSQTRSAFWRFHTRGVAEEGVCTVEALFFFLEALVKQGKLSDPRFTAPHAFDNLLWYFVYQHQVVRQAVQKRQQGRTALGQGQETPEPESQDGGTQPWQKPPSQQQQKKRRGGQQQKQSQKKKHDDVQQKQNQKKLQQEAADEDVETGAGFVEQHLTVSGGKDSANLEEPGPQQKQQQQHHQSGECQDGSMELLKGDRQSSDECDTARAVADSVGDDALEAGRPSQSWASDSGPEETAAVSVAGSSELLVQQRPSEVITRGLDICDISGEVAIGDGVEDHKSKRARIKVCSWTTEYARDRLEL